ncbi:hypothetical protein BK816_02485 [Boudabousia tangfeifanii]|uniref:Glycosyltransferase subfamily 4-like N-terminal domain-containing protein n=1 Tax=Boudabousia tangfeifanii TaxID=1912795 RepID=A0A1D9MJ47_9ACTO|nr:glycosyltransferase [Boudabousia tangfeifanii]AOZ72306.1 hypothetical protein BK816_02485 [Boudabousia tangfeifanii]
MKHSQNAIVTSRIYAPEIGAAAFRLEATAKQMTSYGPVTVLTGTLPKGMSEAKPHPKLQIKRAPVKRDKDGYVRGLLPYLSFDLPLFFRLLAQPKPKYILTEPPPTTGLVVACYCRLKKVPFAYFAADLITESHEAIMPKFVVKLMQRVQKFILANASVVLTINQDMVAPAKKAGAKVVEVVQNGIDTERFQPPTKPLNPELAERYGITKPYFFYGGTASDLQKAGIFAQALIQDPRLADYQLLYLTQGNEQAELEALAQAHPTKILVHGLASPDIAAELQGHAIASLASIKPGNGYDFAYPTKMYASYACATPIVYAGVGPAAADISDNNLGVAEADFTPKAVGQAMVNVVAKQTVPAKKKAMRDNIRNWVCEHRSLQKTGQRAAAYVEKYCA